MKKIIYFFGVILGVLVNFSLYHTNISAEQIENNKDNKTNGKENLKNEEDKYYDARCTNKDSFVIDNIRFYCKNNRIVGVGLVHVSHAAHHSARF